jgi:TonB family protein
MLSRRFASILISAVLTTNSLAENKGKEVAALIDRARQLSDVRADGSQAFVLEVEFRIQSDPAHPTNGTYTETWVSRSLSRTEISAGDYHRTEVINEKKRSVQSSPSGMDKDITSAVNTIAYRMDRLQLDSKGADKIIDKTSGSWLLRCIVGHPDGLGGRMELCFDKSGGQFAAESMPYYSQGGEQVKKCVFQDFQKFGDKSFPMSARCLDRGGETIEGKVVQLTFKTPNDESVFAALPGAKEFPNCDVLPVTPPVAVEMPDPMIGPSWPVVLSLFVGTDGHPHDLQVVTSAGEEWDKAALDAVRRWRFKPAMCEGKPMEATVNVAVVSH